MNTRNTTLADGEGSADVNGRKPVYLQVGDPGGPLVLHNHGGPSGRLEAA
ncbi:MAG: hypothetical protein QOK18_3839 [Mycobacterium sp.]|nr:hypothetical protein [Mycobacterium sp.]